MASHKSSVTTLKIVHDTALINIMVMKD